MSSGLSELATGQARVMSPQMQPNTRYPRGYEKVPTQDPNVIYHEMPEQRYI
jgi:hypothetical protein